MSEVDSIFESMRQDMWAGAMAVLVNVGLYLAVPIIVVLLIIRIVFRLRGPMYQILSVLIMIGWTWFWAMNIFPTITHSL